MQVQCGNFGAHQTNGDFPMFRRIAVVLASFLVTLGLTAAPGTPVIAADGAPRVRLTTNMGAIVLELDAARAPKTVENFLTYVRAGFYDGTIFHRVIRGFMIQGGGMMPGLEGKPTRGPIPNEADNGLKNAAGTIAMARTGDPHSATAQFFINTVDNRALDHRDKSPQGWGYTVFGRVVEGMDVVRIIEGGPTGPSAGHMDVPRSDVIITKAEIL
jgi:peptidyl-prolyl cis-trans isomerase B (cyclophilin B)